MKLDLLAIGAHPDDAELQGRNIGAAIISFAEQKARELGYSVLMMHARDPVIGFYQKCGYHIAGDQFFEVGMGHHKMEKELVNTTS